MKGSVMTFASKCSWRHNGGSGKSSIEKGDLASSLCLHLFLVLFFVSSAHCQGWQRKYHRTKMPYNFTSEPDSKLTQSSKLYTNNARKYSTTWNPPFRIRDEDRRINFNYVDYDRPRNFRTRWLLETDKNILVGFTHDPYRYSVNKIDFAKEIASRRNVTSNEMQTSSEITNSRESGRSDLGSTFKSQHINATGEQGKRTESRGKRGVIHLYNMISCATGCDPVSYKGYGCYCGFLGSGRATDGVDKCCKFHDQCYEGIYCPFFTVYFQPYYWTCYRGEPLCALENQETSGQIINGCAARLCECDRKLAMCLRRYRCPKNRALCRSSPLRLLQNLIMA